MQKQKKEIKCCILNNNPTSEERWAKSLLPICDPTPNHCPSTVSTQRRAAAEQRDSAGYVQSTKHMQIAKKHRLYVQKYEL
jgi:hypothetical protein